MRVAIDYRPALAHPPGVGRYLRELVRALAPLAERPELVLVDAGREPTCYAPRDAGLEPWPARVERVRLALPRRVLGVASALGLGADVLAGGRIDLVHQARTPPLPVRRAREVVAVAEWPDLGSGAEAELVRRLERAARVQVFSRAAAELVATRAGLPFARIEQIAVGCEHWRRDLARARGHTEPPRVSDVADSAEIVTLGRIEQHAHALAGLAALERLRAGGLDVRWRIVAPRSSRGSPSAVASGSFAAALERSPARAAVTWEPPAGPLERDPAVHERALPELVARAGVLLHLVGTALTPITPLEALALGVPVVAARLPAFEEALDGGAELLAADELADLCGGIALAERIERALASRTTPSEIERRTRIASAFTWERCARETLAGWIHAAS